MLHHYCGQFLEYCQLADLSARSILALNSRLNELTFFLKTRRIRSVKRVRYRHLIDFTVDYNAPSIHVTTSRVWLSGNFTIFCHFTRSYLKCAICLAMDYHVTFSYRSIRPQFKI